MCVYVCVCVCLLRVCQCGCGSVGVWDYTCIYVCCHICQKRRSINLVSEATIVPGNYYNLVTYMRVCARIWMQYHYECHPKHHADLYNYLECCVFGEPYYRTMLLCSHKQVHLNYDHRIVLLSDTTSGMHWVQHGQPVCVSSQYGRRYALVSNMAAVMR